MITSTNKTSLALIKEVTAGTTPATPAFQVLPTLSGGPQGNLSTAMSEAINDSRSVSDLIVVDSEVSGSVNFELSYDPYVQIFESLMQSTISTEIISASDLSIATSDGLTGTIDTVAEDFVASNLDVDQHIKMLGFTNSTNNGIYRITAIATTSLSVTAVTTVMVTEAAGAAIVLYGNMIRNGTENPDSFTFVKRILGLTDTAYMYYPGCQISSVALSFEVGSILKGSFDIVGLTEEVTEIAKTGQSFVDVPDYSLMNSVTSVAALLVEGLPADTEFSSFNLTYNNNINRAKAIGTLGSVSLASFTLEAKASVSVYFEDTTTYNYYANSTEFAVTLVTRDVDNNYYVFRFPKCKFESLDSLVPGMDNFYMLNGSLVALQDETLGYTMQVDMI